MKLKLNSTESNKWFKSSVVSSRIYLLLLTPDTGSEWYSVTSKLVPLSSPAGVFVRNIPESVKPLSDHRTPIFNLLDIDCLRLELSPCIISKNTLTDHVQFVLTEVFITFFLGKETVHGGPGLNILQNMEFCFIT